MDEGIADVNAVEDNIDTSKNKRSYEAHNVKADDAGDEAGPSKSTRSKNGGADIAHMLSSTDKGDKAPKAKTKGEDKDIVTDAVVEEMLRPTTPVMRRDHVC